MRKFIRLLLRYKKVAPPNLTICSIVSNGNALHLKIYAELTKKSSIKNIKKAYILNNCRHIKLYNRQKKIVRGCKIGYYIQLSSIFF